jgi:hypothetical protein
MQDSVAKSTDKRIGTRVYFFWRSVEGGIYTAVACVLAVTAVVALAGCGLVLWQGVHTWNSGDTMLRVIDRLLLVLMVVEILHTVRISIRSHVLVAEPFLIVGLIATIRRILVIALEAANVSDPQTGSAERETIFRESVIELGLLGLLVLVFVIAICLLRRSPAAPEEDA